MAFSYRQPTLSFNTCPKTSCNVLLALVTFILTALPHAHAATPQTINFPAIGDRRSTDAPLTLAPTATSGLPVTCAVVSTGGVVTVSANVLTFSGVPGAVTVKASQAGDTAHQAAQDVYRTFLVISPSQIFVKVSAGSHSAAIANDGTLWTWGLNDYGQLGDGTTTSRNRPQQVGTATTWTAVACGVQHTIALRSDGTLWSWGRNNYGQLGDTSTTSRGTPAQVTTYANWTAIASGGEHSLARRADGTLWGWGHNYAAQLGLGDQTNRLAPVQIGTDTTWTTFACNYEQSVALKSDGTLWSWGRSPSTSTQTFNAFGTGQGEGEGEGGGITTNGSITIGNPWVPPSPYGKSAVPSLLSASTDWVEVSCGYSHSAARRADGTVWTWNGIYYMMPSTMPERLGTQSEWAGISSGGSFLASLHTNGTLWAVGTNSSGQLGDGSQISRTTLAQVGTASNWAAMDAGIGHTLALRTDGSLWTWGANTHGQLGKGATEPALPVLDPDSKRPARISPYPSARPLAFSAPPSPLSLGQPVVLAATSASGLPISYVVTGPATLSGSTLTPIGPGSITVTASEATDDAWLPVQPVTHTLQVQETPREAWRYSHFGVTANTGAAADTADMDKDGLPNLLEFAFGLNPTSASSNRLPQPVLNRAAQTFTVSFTEPAEAVGTGLIYSATASTSLQPGSGTLVPDTGSGGTHVFSVSTSGQKSVFIQLQVTAP